MFVEGSTLPEKKTETITYKRTKKERDETKIIGTYGRRKSVEK